MADKTSDSEHRNLLRSSLGSTGIRDSSAVINTSVISITSTSSSGSNSYEVESEVGREALQEICCSVLSRVLDFPDGQLETFLGFGESAVGNGDGGVNVAKNIIAGLRYMKKGLSAVTHMYFQQQGEVTQCENVTAARVLVIGAPITISNQVPLLQVITHMHNYVLLEGLFRKPGNKLRIEQMVYDLEHSGIDEIVANTNYTGHDYASLLKQYLSELPEPILLKRHLNAYLQVSDLSSTSSKIRCIQLLMLLLPPCHRIVLQHLLDLFSRVICCSQSRMDALNLALVFAPTLFLASQSESLSAASLSSLSSLLKFMIENPEEIFEVPVEVQVVADRYCRKKRCISGVKHDVSSSVVDDDVAMDMYSTCCKRECVEDFHKSGQDRAAAEIAQLKDFIMKMPDGPQKAHFLKRFDSAKKQSRTPTQSKLGLLKVRLGSNSKSKCSRSFWNNKENATPQTSAKAQSSTDVLLKPCLKKGSLIPEFDKVDPCSLNCKTPYKSNPSRNDQTPLLKQVRIVATNSPIVTDV